MKIDFPHTQSAHCENGVVSNLMKFHGYDFSEPMVFGIGAGIFFSYMPFIKLYGIPVTSYRILPSLIFKRFAKRINMEVEAHTYRRPVDAMKALDAKLEEGVPVGMLTSVFYLTYLPEAYRFHFNAHNIVVYGREGNDYLVSDPVMETTTTIAYDDLVRARFAKGVPEPNGKMYFPKSLPKGYDPKTAIWQGIKQATWAMTEIPLPFFASKGVRYLAGRMRHWPERLGDKMAIKYLANVIRMQEEIGTGGAGFRFIYAAFLDESSRLINDPDLFELSRQLTVTGDRWREFAYYAGRVCKSRKTDTLSFAELSDILLDCADQEQQIFGKLRILAKQK